MILTKKIKVQVFEVLATYHKKNDNNGFLSILQFIDENGGRINSIKLSKELLHPLSEKACCNILNQLAATGYVTLNGGIYELTLFGKEAAIAEEFYEKKRKAIKLFIAEENELIPQRIIKIEESSKADTSLPENSNFHEISNYEDPLKKIQLDGVYKLEWFEPKFKQHNSIEAELVIKSNDKGSELRIMDFKAHLDENEEKIKDNILKNFYPNDYLPDNKLLKVNFNQNNLNLYTDKIIEKPRFRKTLFEPVKIQNIKLSPMNQIEARLWFKKYLVHKLNQYLFTDEEFIRYANSIAMEFDLFDDFLHNSVSRGKMINELDEPADFYKKAMLETIDYLNY